MSSNRESKEVRNESIRVLTQILTAAGFAATAGADPYVIGSGVFISQFLGLRSKLKVNRVETFIVELGKYIRTIDTDFDMDNVDSEDFGDFFEELLIRVSRTNSAGKLERFKRIVIGQILNPETFDKASRFGELASQLNDEHIILLESYIGTQPVIDNIASSISDENEKRAVLTGLITENRHPRLLQDRSKIDAKLVKLKNEIDSIFESRLERFQNTFSIDPFMFLNDLSLSGLIYNYAKGTFSDSGKHIHYRPTPLAEEFMGFLHEIDPYPAN